MIVKDVVLFIELAQLLFFTHYIFLILLLFEFHMFKVFGVVGDGLSELFDLIFKLLMRKTN